MLRRLALALAMVAGLMVPATALAAPCQFVLGFATIAQLVPQVGQCLDGQSYASNGDGQQHTTGGLLVWRKADNWTAFTDGYRTWINGPNGIQLRLNTDRFQWESGGAAAVTGAGRPPSVLPALLTAPLADVATWTEGQQLLADANSIGVTYYAEPIPEPPSTSIFGYFDSSVGQIHINISETRGANDWVIAGVLVHELRHASDFAHGMLARDTAAHCYDSEVRAFLTQGRWYRYAQSRMAQTTGPMVAQLWGINAELDTLQLAGSLAGQAGYNYALRLTLEDWLGPYEETCGNLP